MRLPERPATNVAAAIIFHTKHCCSPNQFCYVAAELQRPDLRLCLLAALSIASKAVEEGACWRLLRSDGKRGAITL